MGVPSKMLLTEGEAGDFRIRNLALEGKDHFRNRYQRTFSSQFSPHCSERKRDEESKS